ncbi:MAG: hypothetical protein FWD87_07445 [Spirochaetaceae bacterium]|nr:hypothetical protein [Spirochaetaceae bacterium]
MLFSFLQTGCSKRPEILSHGEEVYIYPVSIFLLPPAHGEEWFYNVKDFSIITMQARPLIPWPQAIRITDIAETENGTIVILINRKGVVSVCSNNEGAPFCGSEFFSTKITNESLAKFTSGKIITDNNFILCHIYADTFFNDNFYVPLSPFIKIDIDNKKSIHSQHNYPAIINDFSLINLKKRDGNWFSAWKKVDAHATVFKYFMHNSSLGENAIEIAESRFKQANWFLNNSSLSDSIKKFISNIAKAEIDNNYIIEVELRSKDNPVVTTYLLGTAGSNSNHFEKMCIAIEEEKHFISYKGKIYFIENDSLYLLSGVEKLPPNFRYTVLYASGGILYAAWEEQSFFLTGASGLTIIDKKRVDKILQ